MKDNDFHGNSNALTAGEDRGFSALLLAVCLLFYLFFAALDGAVIAVDSPSYIDMEIMREPLYPMLLALLRTSLRALLPSAGADFYLTVTAYLQSILMAAASWSLVMYLRRALRLTKPLTCLLLCMPLTVSLLCRFAAGRTSMYSNSILTEGIAIPLYLLFMRYLYGLCRERTGRSLTACLVLSFLLYSTRKQMIIALALLMLSLFVLYLCGCRTLPSAGRGGSSAGKRCGPDDTGRQGQDAAGKQGRDTAGERCRDTAGKSRLCRAGRGLLAALLAAALVLGGSTLFDMGYNYVVRGEAVRHSGDSRFVTTMVFYTAEREDAQYIEDEEIRELFLAIYDACEEEGYLSHSAGSGWLNRVTHFGDHYDNIQIDTMWPMVNEFVRERYGDDAVTLNGNADDVMQVINLSVGPHNLGKIVCSFLDNVLSGLVTTVAQRRPVLIVYSVLVYALYLLLWIGEALGERRRGAAWQESGVLVLSGLTALSIACNVGLVSLVIFCQTRYTIYNMPLFYISLLLLLDSAVQRHRRNAGRSAAAEAGRPHICLYIGSLQKGGAERVMTNLAEYLYGAGWRVTFVTTYYRPPEYELPHQLWDRETGKPYETSRDGIRRIYSDPPARELEKGRVRGFAARYRTLRAVWKRERPDIILSFIGYNNTFAILTSRGLGIPVVISVRSSPAYEYNTKKLRIPAFALFGLADGVVLQTREAADFFPAAVRRRSVILPNAINADFLHPRYEGERENRVVAVGRLDHNKNQGYLIEQFARAHATHPEYTLHLYGDGPAREEFEQQARELGIGEAVVFEGVVSDVREHIERSRIYVLPSKTEGMPNALLEAMAAGLACISTDCPCGGPRDLIEDGVNGFLVPLPGADRENVTRETPGMAERLLQLMDDPALADRLGREAARVQENYSPDRINAQWKDYLISLMRN